MFLVENTQPNTRAIGTLYLAPGINEVDQKLWEGLKAKTYKTGIQKLLDREILKIRGGTEKLTVALVEKTYDVKTLESMLDSARGPLKGAIRKQIKMITETEPVDEAVGAV